MPINLELRKAWETEWHKRRGEADEYKHHGSDTIIEPAPEGYLRLYYLTTPEHAISNIVFKRIKISRFSELNDPFELLAVNMKGPKFRDQFSNLIENFKEKKGLICLSENWMDPVLWSHYAAKHKGVALGFKVKQNLVRVVSYSDKRLNKKEIEDIKSESKTISDALVYTKFSSWKYENEWRLLCDLDDFGKESSLYFKPMDESFQLEEVILGALCDLNLEKMRSLVSQHHSSAITYKAQLAKQSFRILADEVTVP